MLWHEPVALGPATEPQRPREAPASRKGGRGKGPHSFGGRGHRSKRSENTVVAWQVRPSRTGTKRGTRGQRVSKAIGSGLLTRDSDRAPPPSRPDGLGAVACGGLVVAHSGGTVEDLHLASLGQCARSVRQGVPGWGTGGEMPPVARLAPRKTGRGQGVGISPIEAQPRRTDSVPKRPLGYYGRPDPLPSP